jgi:polyisoprenoid-binding protein YceI
MKKLSVFLMLLLFFVFSSCKNKKESTVIIEDGKLPAEASEDAQLYKVDPQSSILRWTGSKVTAKHFGTVSVLKGKMHVSGNSIEAGKFIIDMRSIKVLDLTDENMNAKLTTHLKDDDFFEVNSFPLSEFEIISVENIDEFSEGEANYLLEGNLKIKNITKSISFPARIVFQNGSLHAKAQFVLDRTRWNIRYGSGKFFEDMGDKMIYDDFEIELDIHAVSEKE